MEKLLGFAMVLTRMSTFFLVVPVFSWKTIPVRIKMASVLVFSIFFSLVNPSMVHSADISVVESVLLMSNEAIYGFALGLIVVMMFTVVKLSGRIIESQMGLSMAQILDPLTGERTQPLSALIEIIFVLLFFSMNGHHMFLLIISKSYEAFPSGSIPTLPLMVEGVVKAGTAMLMATLRLAAPMLAAFLLLLSVLGVFARIMPDMNILFISMPLRVGLGLLMTGIFLPLVQGYMAEFSDWLGKLLPL